MKKYKDNLNEAIKLLEQCKNKLYSGYGSSFINGELNNWIIPDTFLDSKIKEFLKKVENDLLPPHKNQLY